MIAGYGAWLLAAAVIIFTTPVDRWGSATLLVLVVLTATSVAVAHRNRSRPFSTALWWAPVFPILATGYYCLVVWAA